MKKIKNVAIIGMGAIGASYANQMKNHCAEEELGLYCVVSDLEKYEREPLYVNDELLNVKYYSYDMLKDISLDLIIIAVKSYHLEKVMLGMEDMVSEGTVIISLLNGLESERLLAEKFGEKAVLYSTIIGADTHKEKHRVHTYCLGKVVFGDITGKLSEKAMEIKTIFEDFEIDFEIKEDIVRCLWNKLVINVGCNQVSTLYELTYENLRNNKEAMDLMRRAQREVIEVAKRSNVFMGEEVISKWEEDLQMLSPEGRSSMLQDYWLGNPLEVDILGGYICKMGQEFGVDVPVNCWIVDEIQKKTMKQRRLIQEEVEMGR